MPLSVEHLGPTTPSSQTQTHNPQFSNQIDKPDWCLWGNANCGQKGRGVHIWSLYGSPLHKGLYCKVNNIQLIQVTTLDNIIWHKHKNMTNTYYMHACLVNTFLYSASCHFSNMMHHEHQSPEFFWASNVSNQDTPAFNVRLSNECKTHKMSHCK